MNTKLNVKKISKRILQFIVENTIAGLIVSALLVSLLTFSDYQFKTNSIFLFSSWIKGEVYNGDYDCKIINTENIIKNNYKGFAIIKSDANESFYTHFIALDYRDGRFITEDNTTWGTTTDLQTYKDIKLLKFAYYDWKVIYSNSNIIYTEAVKLFFDYYIWIFTLLDKLEKKNI